MEFKNAVPVWAEKYVGERNIQLEFCAEIDFAGEKWDLAVAADNVYRVRINGEFVLHGPQRCGKGFWRRDEKDITHYLKWGKNTVVIEVLHFGVESFEFINQPAFLMAEIFKNGESAVATGKDFICRRDLSREQVVERYAYQRPFIEVRHFPKELSESLETVKVEGVNIVPRTAPYPEFKKVYPIELLAKGEAEIPDDGIDPNNVRFENTDMPDFSYSKEEIGKLYRIIEYNIKLTSREDVNEKIGKGYTFALTENQWQMFRLPAEDSGFITCNIECSEDSLVYIAYDEILVNNDANSMRRYGSTCNTLPLYMKKGSHAVMETEPKTMQYIKVLCKYGSVKISNLCLTEYVNPVGDDVVFECEDDALMRVYNAAVNTFKQNAVDIFMDCPSRERAGWLCDSFFTGRTERDLTGHSFVEKGFLENFFIATSFPNLPEGMLPMCYPADALQGSFIPNWAMFLVIELEEYVKRSGDSNMLLLAKERLYGLEKYFCNFINKDGLLEKLDGWVFVEWSQANKWVQDVNFPSNMMYYAMLKSMARMYSDSALDIKAEKIKAKIRELSFNGTFFRDHQVYENGVLSTPEDITEVCQYYAFFTGVADKETYPELIRIIAEDFGAGHKCEKTHPGVYPANAFIGNYLRMEVLSQNGHRRQIIGEIKDYFDYMARLTGTLWEMEKDNASCNHGFASHVVRFIFRDCLGISEVDEQNRTVVLNSDFTSPANAHAVLPLKNGSITVDVVDGVRKLSVSGGYTIV